MDSARDKYSLEIIDAEKLWDIDVDKDAYVCPGCNVQVFPASFNKGVNKRRPYFTLMDNKHVQPCGIAGLEKTIKRAKRESVGAPDGFPEPFPNRLVLSDARPVTAGSGSGAGASIGATSTSRSNATRVASTYHGHTVQTIRPVCRIFMEYPYDRDHLEMAIPGCPGSTYGRVFSKLDFQGIRPFQTRTRLFYAALRWNTPIDTDEHIEWMLNAGSWGEGEERPTAFYRVRIQWSHWTERQRNTLRHELDIAQDAVKGKTGVPEKAWLFFVGTQDTSDPGLLVATRYQLICCRVGEMSWPKR